MAEKGYELVADSERYLVVVEERADVCCDWIETRFHLQNGSLMKEMKKAAENMAHSWQDTAAGNIFAGSMSGVKKAASGGVFLVFLFLYGVDCERMGQKFCRYFHAVQKICRQGD